MGLYQTADLDIPKMTLFGSLAGFESEKASLDISITGEPADMSHTILVCERHVSYSF